MEERLDNAISTEVSCNNSVMCSGLLHLHIYAKFEFFGQMAREFCLIGVLIVAATAVGLKADPRVIAELEGTHAESLSLQDDIYNSLVIAVGGDPAENISEFLMNLMVSEYLTDNLLPRNVQE